MRYIQCNFYQVILEQMVLLLQLIEHFIIRMLQEYSFFLSRIKYLTYDDVINFIARITTTNMGPHLYRSLMDITT